MQEIGSKSGCAAARCGSRGHGGRNGIFLPAHDEKEQGEGRTDDENGGYGLESVSAVVKGTEGIYAGTAA